MIVPLSHADTLFYDELIEMGETATSTSSMREEELFLTPLSISIVSAKQIQQAGITTIAEAMKLVPGVIVREQTNGGFTVHIRGLKNLTKEDAISSLENNTTLIMIDNRIVFDYFSGSLFWETLPIAVDDIDRIEVVRGAVSALYGANAITGLIHIFTKRATDDASIKTSLVAGSHNSQIVQLAAETAFDFAKVRLTALSENRDRYEENYFSFIDREYKNPDEVVLTSTEELTTNTARAVNKESFMLTVNNDPLELFNFDLSLFYQKSEVQKVYISANDIPFSHNESESRGINLKLNYGDFNSRISHKSGMFETTGFPDFQYDTKNTQANISYKIKFPKWFIQPAIDWRRITYESDFIGGERSTIETDYMLRVEYNPLRNWRFISALSYSEFNAPKDNYLNYQFMTTYQMSFDTSVRASVQSAISSPFMVKQYIDIEFVFPNDPSQRIDVKGDKEGRLSNVKTYELGLRKQLRINNYLEFELFHTEFKGLTAYVTQPPVVMGSQTVTERSLLNQPQEVVQDGMTVNWLYERANWNINTYFTWQTTHIYNQVNNLATGEGTFDEYNDATPKLYGGINFNWQVLDKLNVNVLSNYLHQHSFSLPAPQGTQEIPSAMYSNITLSYRHNKNTGGYLSIKNLSDQKQSQYFYSDRIAQSIWLGFDIKFK